VHWDVLAVLLGGISRGGVADVGDERLAEPTQFRFDGGDGLWIEGRQDESAMRPTSGLSARTSFNQSVVMLAICSGIIGMARA
jgi:hypothetical protein